MLKNRKLILFQIMLILIAFLAFCEVTNLPKAEATTSATASKCGAARLSLVKEFKPTVSAMCDSTWMYVSSLEVPNDEMMVGITGWNQQVPIPFVMSDQLSTLWKIPIKPKYSSATTATTGVGATALMVNGVPLFNATKPSQNGNQSAYSASADPKLNGELDGCDGHSGRGDDYHYHAYPACLVKKLVSKAGSSAKNRQLGWALDGFPIFGFTESTGVVAKQLDKCMGHDLKDGRGYHYHFSALAPYSPMCFHGVLPLENNPEHQPAAAPLRQPGQPVKVLITSMQFDPTSKSTLEFTYNGLKGAVSYSPAESTDPTKDCWRFEYINPPPGSPGSGSQLVCRNRYGRN